MKQRNDYIEESNRQKIAEIKVQNHIRMQTFKSGLIEKTFSEAKEKLERTRQRIIDEDITFADAAREVSDEEETKFEGGRHERRVGKLSNPT